MQQTKKISFKGAAYADDISVICKKKALNAYNKSSMNTKDLQEDQGWNSMLTRLKF
jgi:hypothetical protein